MALVVSLASQRSTRLSQDEEVGMKWKSYGRKWVTSREGGGVSWE